MLQTHPSASSIQRRRLLHRRQQSLESPILAPPNPPNLRRANSTRLRSGRGHSIDLGAIAGASPSAPRQISSQDSLPPATGPPPARTQEQDTPLTTISDQQHFIKQEPQEHSKAQPGLHPSTATPQTMNFQSHLHQQLNGVPNPSAAVVNSEQAAAMQSLQSHLLWYEQKFGLGAMNVNTQAPSVQANYILTGEDSTTTFNAQGQSTPVSMSAVTVHDASKTVPNTPQQKSWPSPPPSHLKHSRSQSYQLDVAPMPSLHNPISFSQASKVYQTPPFKGIDLCEHDYAASVYSSSNTDGSSPPHQHATPLPTLFEDASLSLGGHEAVLLQAAAGAADPDFNDPNFTVGGLTTCPEQAALDAAGIDATYIDTGISEEVLNSWLIAPTGKNEPYICKFKGCDARVNRKENARSHVQNHLDDRRFQCNPCGKRFSRMHDTKRHFLTHTQERPAVCPCGKTFARADALTRHRQRDMCAGVLPGFEKTDEDRPKRGRPKKDKSQDGNEAGDKTRRKTNRPDMETRTRRAHLARTMDRVNAALEQYAASSTSAASERTMPDTPPHDHDTMDTADFLNLEGSNDQFNSATSTWLDTPPTSPPSSSPAKASAAKIYIDLSTDDAFGGISPAKLSNHSSPSVTAGALPSLHNSPSPVMNPTEALFKDYSSPSVFDATTGFHGESSPIDADAADVFDFNILDTHPNAANHEVFSPAGHSESGSSSYHSDFDTMHYSNDQIKSNNTLAPSAVLTSGHTTHNALGELDDDIFMSQEPEYGEICEMLDAWINRH